MSKNQRVYISYNDIFTYTVRDSAETIDMFGQDYLDDYGHNIPQDKLLEYKAVKK